MFGVFISPTWPTWMVPLYDKCRSTNQSHGCYNNKICYKIIHHRKTSKTTYAFGVSDFWLCSYIYIVLVCICLNKFRWCRLGKHSECSKDDQHIQVGPVNFPDADSVPSSELTYPFSQPALLSRCFSGFPQVGYVRFLEGTTYSDSSDSQKWRSVRSLLTHHLAFYLSRISIVYLQILVSHT